LSISCHTFAPIQEYFSTLLQRIVNMTNLKCIAGKLAFITLFGFFILQSQSAFSQDGKQLFQQNCASCHAMEKVLTGPALMGATDRWPDQKMMHAWIKNNQKVLASGYPHAVAVYNEFNKTPMNVFEGSLSDQQIDAIIDYIKNYKPQAAATGTPTPGAATTSSSNDTLLYGILTIILAIVAFVLLQVNANLKKMADDKEGVPAHEPVPVWRNKVYIMFATLVLFLIGGYYTVMGAISLGRTQNYEPQQPIFYSHKVHAGTNQISCLYCHGNTQDGKQANIPSVNICMNCHMAINEYKGEPLYDADGNEINGTMQIQKLYEYAGYTPGKPWDASKAKPIAWTRIHNLPDHVYFNHSQHVVAGKVQCQTCHGEIQKMDEVHQFADLSMGWCINCHRETQVKFSDNGFYSMYEKYHQDIKNGVLDTSKITVEKIGGTECQKCHY
jgi:mono/diheme cytochrome c family protein